MNKIILGTGIFFVIYYIVLTSIMGPIVFSKYLFYFGMLLILYNFVNKKLKNNNSFIKLKKIAAPIVSFCLIIFIIIEVVIVGYSFVRNTDEADYLIVLGAGLRGETMTMTLRQRMEASYEYLEKHNNCKYIVVSGGQGLGESIAESEAMKRYLISKGVDENRIIAEDKSTSTYENLEFSKQLIQKHSNKNIGNLKVKVATSDFHSLRAYLLSKKCGYKNITSYGCPINPIFIPTYYVREFFALIKTIVFDISL